MFKIDKKVVTLVVIVSFVLFALGYLYYLNYRVENFATITEVQDITSGAPVTLRDTDQVSFSKGGTLTQILGSNNSALANISNQLSTLSSLESNVGNLSSLKTNDKNIVEAINNLNNKIDNLNNSYSSRIAKYVQTDKTASPVVVRTGNNINTVISTCPSLSASGAPVLVTVSGDARPLTNFIDPSQLNSMWCTLAIFRNDVIMDRTPITLFSVGDHRIVPFNISFIDTPSAGPTTYTCKVTSSNNYTNGQLNTYTAPTWTFSSGSKAPNMFALELS